MTGGSLQECIDLGDQYVTDFVAPAEEKTVAIGSLEVGIGPKSGVA